MAVFSTITHSRSRKYDYFYWNFLTFKLRKAGLLMEHNSTQGQCCIHYFILEFSNNISCLCCNFNIDFIEVMGQNTSKIDTTTNDQL